MTPKKNLRVVHLRDCFFSASSALNFGGGICSSLRHTELSKAKDPAPSVAGSLLKSSDLLSRGLSRCYQRNASMPALTVLGKPIEYTNGFAVVPAPAMFTWYFTSPMFSTETKPRRPGISSR